MSESESPDRLGREITVEDVRSLTGPATPHFALQIRTRIERLIAGLPPDHPARVEGEREAERIVKEARDRQSQLVSEQEVTKQAERAAEDIIEDARAREREIRLGAEDYADEILNTLEANLSKFIAAVQRGRERLQGKDEPAEVG